MTKVTPKIEIAKRYASALFENAIEEGVIDVVLKNLQEISDLINSSDDLKVLMGSEIIERNEKVEALFLISDRLNTNPLVRNFLGVLAQNGRLSSFEKTKDVFETLYQKHQGILSVTATTAHPLDVDLSKRLTDVLNKIFNQEISLTLLVDSRLIGGMTVKVGSQMFDGSIKSKLQKLQFAMKGA